MSKDRIDGQGAKIDIRVWMGDPCWRKIVDLECKVPPNRWLSVLAFEREMHFPDWRISDHVLVRDDRGNAKSWFFTSKIEEETSSCPH